MRLILEIENPSVIEKISALIKNQTPDFWDELTHKQRSDIEKAMDELDSEKGIEWIEFKTQLFEET